MPWIRDGDGLKLVGVCHYDTAQIRGLIKELSKSRNRPEKVCSLLEGLLATGRASKELVWRLSKWCDWNDSSERVARSIAHQLFHGNICRRLLYQHDMPIPDHATAELDRQISIGDLRPICPNCHVVIHLNRHPFTIDEVKAMVARARESKRTADSFKEGMDPTA